MNLINSILGVIILAILVIIGYRVGQMAIELNTPIIPKTSTAELVIPEQPATTTIRWNHFPLTVYINGDFVQQKNPEYVADVKKALDIWQSTGIVSFTVVDNPEADITIGWAPNLKEKATDTLGNTDLKFTDISQFGIIQNATVELLTKSESRQLNSKDMTNLALHEIGHAIGLQHINEDDVMNPTLTIPSNAVKEISISNTNNLQELYKSPAKPDLRIGGVNATKATFTRFGQNYFYLNISLEIQNVGLVDAKSYNIQLRADGLVVNEAPQVGLEIGNILSVFQGNLRIDRNFTSVQVNVDLDDNVDELDETNNFIEISV